MRGHEGKGYPCDYCSKVFKTIQSKQYHESEHSGVYDSPAPSVIKDSTTKVSMNSTFQTVKYRRSGFSRTCFRFVILLLGMKSYVVVIY